MDHIETQINVLGFAVLDGILDKNGWETGVIAALEDMDGPLDAVQRKKSLRVARRSFEQYSSTRLPI
jgi:hypothetical protein